MDRMQLDNPILLRLRDLARHELGINISDGKLFGFRSKIESLLNKESIPSLEALLKLLNNQNAEAWDMFIKYITINYTFFFREKRQLELLVSEATSRKIKSPKIWCAAASTGEEVYSLAIMMYEKGIYDFLVIASDIDKTVLIQMKKAVYDINKLHELPNRLLEKYFTKVISPGNEKYKVKDFLKKHVMAKKLNISEPLTFEKQFDFILCRNVLIYFDSDGRNKTIRILLNNLTKNGILFLGQSESLVGTDISLKQVMPSAYRKEH